MSNTQSVAEWLLDQFKIEMMRKLMLRVARHPDDNFLSMSVGDMQTYPLSKIIEKMNEELEELYVARGFSDSTAARWECVDVGNMAFIEWALRWAQEKEGLPQVGKHTLGQVCEECGGGLCELHDQF